jgi:hypothetical protein
MLLPIFILLLVLSPVLLPAVITLGHMLTGPAPSTQDRAAANFPRRTASPRSTAAAAA